MLFMVSQVCSVELLVHKFLVGILRRNGISRQIHLSKAALISLLLTPQILADIGILKIPGSPHCFNLV